MTASPRVVIDGFHRESGDDDTDLVNLVYAVEAYLRRTGRADLSVTIDRPPAPPKGPPA